MMSLALTTAYTRVTQGGEKRQAIVGDESLTNTDYYEENRSQAVFQC